MALGLMQAGLDVRFAFDNNQAAVDTYRANIGEHGYCLDARYVSGQDILEKIEVPHGAVDVLSGGPPCQGFSKQKRGAHLLDDPRNSLILDYIRLVEEVNPKTFLFENVQIFGQKRGKDLIEELKQRLRRYFIHSYFICSSEFGLAQTRGRFLMIGVRKDISTDTPVLVKSRKNRTVRDVIGSLPAPPNDRSEHPDIPNHAKARITKINEKRFSHVPPGGGWQSIPEELRLPCHKGVDPKKGGWPDVYGRLEWDGKCPTITGGFDNFSRGRYGHPEQNRALTLREGAMLQGFPIDFAFVGTRHDIRHQIGNAVPPPLAKAAGLSIIHLLNKSRLTENLSVNTQNSKQLELAV